MASFVEVTTSRVRAAMTCTGPLLALFEWVERSGLVTTGSDGELYGTVAPHWPNGVGTQLLLRGWTVDEVDSLAPWFGP